MARKLFEESRRGTRLTGLDVTRGAALLGVVTMNYVAVLNAGHAPWSRLQPRWLGWLLDPFRGPLTTRFALVFVVVAGISSTLMAQHHSTDRHALRIRIARRAALLFLAGVIFHTIWPGEILHFYALYMVIGLGVLDARSRWLLVVGVAAMVFAAVIQVWVRDRYGVLRRPHWLLPGELHSGSHLAGDVLVVGTHPVTPWVAFFMLGMWLGRLPLDDPKVRARLAAGGGAVFAMGLIIQQAGFAVLAERWHWALSAGPRRPMPLYVLASCGLATVAVMAALEASKRWRAAPLDWLAATGRCSLSLYLLHGILAATAVWALGLHGHTGLTVSVLAAAGYWASAIGLATWWQARWTIGPAEWCYRRLTS